MARIIRAQDVHRPSRLHRPSGLRLHSMGNKKACATNSEILTKVGAVPEQNGVLEWACLCVAAIICGLVLISALAPVTNWDSGVAHLALPSDYVRDGKIHLLIGNIYSAYLQALHCIFTSIFYWSDERGVMLFC